MKIFRQHPLHENLNTLELHEGTKVLGVQVFYGIARLLVEVEYEKWEEQPPPLESRVFQILELDNEVHISAKAYVGSFVLDDDIYGVYELWP